MKFIQTSATDTISDLRLELYQGLISPIDAMWEQLYIGSSQHYLIENEDKIGGYCCIDEGANLLQMFLVEAFYSQADQVVLSLIESKLITSAKLSSCEPVTFNACLFHSKSIQPNTLCYEHPNRALKNVALLNLQLASKEEIPAIKSYLKEQVGLDDTFGYTENLVTRREIYALKDSDAIIAISECRMSDSQPKYADLGIIVDRDYQGRGHATQVMQLQVNRVLAANSLPICSTTVDNIASRKAIERSGFYCSSIIFDISFMEG